MVEITFHNGDTILVEHSLDALLGLVASARLRGGVGRTAPAIVVAGDNPTAINPDAIRSYVEVSA